MEFGFALFWPDGLCPPPAAPCSVDFGEGVAVDIADIGDDAAELCAWGVEGVTAGWMLFTFLPVELSESFPSVSSDDSLGLSALRLAAASFSAFVSAT